MTLTQFVFDNTRYYGYFVFSVGLVANLLCILILCRKSQRRLTINFYLIALAVTDFCSLLCSLVDKWLATIYKISLRNNSLFLCKAFPFLDRLFFTLSSWIVVIITVQRTRAIKSPLGGDFTRGRIWLRNIVLLVITTLLLTVIFIPTLFYFNFTERLSKNETKEMICTSTEPEAYHITKYVIFNSVYSFIPCAILSVCTYIIIKNLTKRRQFLASQHHIQSDQYRQNDKNMRLILSINIMFFVFTLPFATLGMILTFSDQKSKFTNNILKPIYRISYTLSYTNSLLNFFIYIVSGRSFRKELVNLCKNPLRRLRKKRSLAAPSSQLSLHATTITHI